MNSFWSRLYDWSKDRRYAALFLVSFIVFLGLAIPGVLFYLQIRTLNLPLVYLLPTTCVLAAALVWISIRSFNTRRQGPSNYSPLSRDELTKARSKLLKDRKLKKL